MEKAVCGKKVGKRELDFLKQIIAILVSGKGSGINIEALIDGPQHFAAERLIREFGSRQELADLAMNAYLNRFEQDRNTLVRDTAGLSYACRLAELFPISSESAERLVHNIARAGWYGRLEGFAREYCHRNPTPEEVGLLFEKYTHSGCYGTSTDETLTAYAKKYMPAEQALEYVSLLAKRNERNNPIYYPGAGF